MLDEALSLGLLCNTAAVLSLTLGKKIDGLIDKDLVDASGRVHTGLTNTPLPILKTSEMEVKKILQEAGLEKDILVVDITDAAQTTKNYKDYEEKLKGKKTEELKVLGIALAGTQKQVKSLTGNLGLLR
ncbi:MAG: DUF2000 domain-containing protein [Candidatus Levybacteria bacterium]|nr:DUF2000 domain-containing protein [Candidatus Levybacteria bacterium]